VILVPIVSGIITFLVRNESVLLGNHGPSSWYESTMIMMMMMTRASLHESFLESDTCHGMFSSAGTEELWIWTRLLGYGSWEAAGRFQHVQQLRAGVSPPPSSCEAGRVTRG